ncbi:Uncharacterized membrane protein [Flexibacter flexilis DSM 6793]|uniref:Uncharacterized membrane protein n=1 Tax=Flexibacter flexilis DSM 6793 TaxID=927664 RepID=A0A1I1DX27_9BACT|nr:DUF1003 domain-containing protein [Flexibacter flexilis]SFB77588.1 Uncharacterized membrane protein [Flexibacter flexilis DSM 6793]
MKKHKQYLQKMLASEDAQMQKLHDIVQDAIMEEQLLTSKLSDDEENPSFGDRLADKVADFGGSWAFIITFGSILLCWIILNSFILISKPFDPYPYILLNLLLSCVAAMQAPVIMMSQNRQEAKDRKRSENDYMINLKSELEIRNLHQKIDLSTEEQYKHLCEIQQQQIELMLDILKHVKNPSAAGKTDSSNKA